MRLRYASASVLALTLVAGAPGLAVAQNAGAPAGAPPAAAPAPGAAPAGAGNGVGPAGAGPAATGTVAPVNNGGGYGGGGGWWGLIGLIGLFGLFGGRRRGAPPATGIGPGVRTTGLGAPLAGTDTVLGPDGRRDTTLPP